MGSQNQFDVIILGGGIIGALSAFELAKNGSKTLLLDKYPFRTGASAFSAAMLESQLDAHRGEPFFSLAQASARLFPTLHKEILSLTGIDFQYEVCGILQLAVTEEEAIILKKEVERQNGMGLKTKWMELPDIQSAFPEIAFPCKGGIFFEEDGQVNGIRFLEGALKAAEKSGALLKDAAGNIDFTFNKNDGATGVHTATGDFFGKKIILATGAWTDELLKPLGVSLGIEPIRGQLAVYEIPSSAFPFPVYTKKDGYITPKRDGTTLAGTTVERAEFDGSTTKEGRDKIVNHAETLVPAIKKFPLRTMTAGLRPKSPSELPFLGPLPSYPNVIVAAGHYRNGVLLAPITAKIMTALCLNQKPPVDISPFLPSSA